MSDRFSGSGYWLAVNGRWRALAMIALTGCGPDSASGIDGLESTHDEPELAWVYQPSGCGHANGVVALGADAIVVGSIDGQPWVTRIDSRGQLVWEQIVAREGQHFAIDHGHDDASVIAVGRNTLDGVRHGSIETFASASGEIGSSWLELGGPGSALYGVATIESGYAVTGIQADFDMLLGVVDPDAGSLTTWPAPTGSGLSAAVGFGVRSIDSGGLAVCGRESWGEGGTSWTARFDASGNELWNASGPDPGVGATLDCWSLAVGPDDDVFVADYGYTGARLASYATDDGALRWQASEPSVGAQAIDVGLDGTVYVGGWSADPAADPFRSHESGERAGWLAAFEPDGELRWRVSAAMPLSILAVRVHDDGALTVVGDLEPDGACSRPWIARFSRAPPA